MDRPDNYLFGEFFLSNKSFTTPNLHVARKDKIVAYDIRD
jgi:hypothetical protein